jgi:copper(I)-binding protein
MLRTFIAAASVALFLAVPALAHEVTAGSLTITDLWTRATPPNAPTAGGFLTIANAGPDADWLVSASSPLAGKAEIHEMSVKDGVMTMRPLAGGVEIPAGATVTLAPGGLHIMFTDLKEPFVEGGKAPVTLTFEKAGTVETFLHVKAIGASESDSGHDHGTMKMDAHE